MPNRDRDRDEREREVWRGRTRGWDDHPDDRSAARRAGPHADHPEHPDHPDDLAMVSRWVDWQKRDDHRREPWIDPHDAPRWDAREVHDREARHGRPSWWDRFEDRFGDRIRSLWQSRGPMRGRGRPPRAYVRSDERIREDIYEILASQLWIDATDVEVAVDKGDVTMTGLVDDRSERRALEEMIDHVLGVKDIHNQLKIRKRSDTDEPVGARERDRVTNAGPRPGAVSALESPSAGADLSEASALAVTADLPPPGWTDPGVMSKRRAAKTPPHATSSRAPRSPRGSSRNRK